MSRAKTRIGLIVNPVAGMGGSVGLKGTDGKMYKKALAMGAEPVTPKRTRDFLEHLHIDAEKRLEWLVGPRQMGERYIEPLGWPYEVVGQIDEETSAQDTRRIANLMVERGVSLLVFVGGDGTARDIHDAIDGKVPVVAVPAGVKVYSGAFALSTRAAAEMVEAFLEGSETSEEEVLDIDEDAFREDRLASRLYGYLVVPEVRKFLQPGKVPSSVNQSSQERKKDIAAFIVETMEPDTLYLLGPGTTVRAVADAMELPKTLLGVDAVYDGALVSEDVNEQEMLTLFEQYEKRSIIVTPIGGNGFIFGRGNKQFTPEVIRRVGKEQITVVSTRKKLKGTGCLRVDTGDFALDQMLCGYIQVTVGYRQSRMIKARCD